MSACRSASLDCVCVYICFKSSRNHKKAQVCFLMFGHVGVIPLYVRTFTWVANPWQLTMCLLIFLILYTYSHTHARTHTGSVLYLMSPDDPAQCVPKLVHQQKVSNSVLSGHYRVNGTQVRNSHRTHNLLEGLRQLQNSFCT